MATYPHNITQSGHEPEFRGIRKLGDVTIVLAKKRRNFGPKRVKIIVTNLLDVSASAVVSQYAIRWAVEIYQPHYDSSESLSLAAA